MSYCNKCCVKVAPTGVTRWFVFYKALAFDSNRDH